MRANKECTRQIRYLMGCFVEIEAQGENRFLSLNAVNAAFSEMKRIEKNLSRFLPDSVISNLNRMAAISPVEVQEEIFDLIERCVRYSELTGGAFDITASPFIELWNGAENHGRTPTHQEIDSASKAVGFQNLVLDRKNQSVYFSHPQMKLDLGAVGKGYAVDRAIELLRHHGIRKGLVNAGSTIYCFGGELRFGITDPMDPQSCITTVLLQDNAISTSATYERFYEIAGKKYGHIIHPKTGCPVEGEISSLSVISESAMESDILSTAFFVNGNHQDIKRLAARSEVKTLLIDSACHIALLPN